MNKYQETFKKIEQYIYDNFNEQYITDNSIPKALSELKQLVDKAKKYDDKETLMKPKIEVINDYVECHYVCSYEIACCPQCGLKVDFGDDYCKRCGQHLNNDF